MKKLATIDRLADEVVTLGAIAGVVYIATTGHATPEALGAVAGLGGYRLKRGKRVAD